MKYVICMEKEELDALIDERCNAAIVRFQNATKSKPQSPPTFIYGIKGLAAFLNVSMVTAQKYKNEKLFPYIQRGRKIIFKPDEVLAGLRNKKTLLHCRIIAKDEK